MLIYKAATRIGMRISISDIGFDVINWRSIHEIGTQNMNHWASFRLPIYRLYSH